MLEIPTYEPPTKYNHSASSIRDFLICEKRYAYYKLFVEWTDSTASLRGRQCHDCLQWLCERGFLKKNFDLAIAKHANTAEEYAAYPLNEAALRRWILNAWPAGINLKPTMMEFWIRRKLPNCQRPLVGRVDCKSLTDPEGREGTCLVDWKSVSSMDKMMSPYEVRRSVQGLAYALTTGIPTVSFVYFSEFHEAECVTHTYTDEELSNGLTYLSSICQAIEHRWKHGGWRLAAPGGLCSNKWCEAWDDCYGQG